MDVGSWTRACVGGTGRWDVGVAGRGGHSVESSLTCAVLAVNDSVGSGRVAREPLVINLWSVIETHMSGLDAHRPVVGAAGVV